MSSNSDKVSKTDSTESQKPNSAAAVAQEAKKRQLALRRQAQEEALKRKTAAERKKRRDKEREEFLAKMRTNLIKVNSVSTGDKEVDSKIEKEVGGWNVKRAGEEYVCPTDLSPVEEFRMTSSRLNRP